MSVQLASVTVLKRIALEYNFGGRYADRHLPRLSKVAAIVAADPLSAINKRLASVVANGGASATKMLRLYAEASASGLQAEALKELITKEADRLLDRALVLVSLKLLAFSGYAQVPKELFDNPRVWYNQVLSLGVNK